MIILAIFVPSATARAEAVVRILLSVFAVFGLAVDSKLSPLLMIAATQAVSVWNVGIKTAAAQNLVAIGFIEGGRQFVDKQLAEMGPMTGAEKRLTAIAVALLDFWAAEGTLHAVGVMLLPGIGVRDWKYAPSHINWGTLSVFAAGISLGSFLYLRRHLQALHCQGGAEDEDAQAA